MNEAAIFSNHIQNECGTRGGRVAQDQARAVELISSLGDTGLADWAVRHKAVVDRFGRFPHRNAVLGRASTPEEEAYNKHLAHWMKEETAYHAIQGTKPQTLAFGLSDSPTGLAAWIVEKFRTWTDCDGNPESAISREEILANISLYWFSAAIGSAFWPYYARMHRPWPIPEGKSIGVPMGYAAFPKEILTPPRSLAEQTYTDIRRWSVMAKGGHFAALEQPDALAREVVAFFAELGENP